MSSVPRGTDHPGGPIVMEKDAQARAEDNELAAPRALLIDRKAFTLAVQTCLSAAVNAHFEGTPFRAHPSPFRMATEVRDALRRATGLDVEVQDWEELLREVKPPFPGERAETQ